MSFLQQVYLMAGQREYFSAELPVGFVGPVKSVTKVSIYRPMARLSRAQNGFGTGLVNHLPSQTIAMTAHRALLILRLTRP
jgi:hypothetical protein